MSIIYSSWFDITIRYRVVVSVQLQETPEHVLTQIVNITSYKIQLQVIYYCFIPTDVHYSNWVHNRKTETRDKGMRVECRRIRRNTSEAKCVILCFRINHCHPNRKRQIFLVLFHCNASANSNFLYYNLYMYHLKNNENIL